VRTPWTLASDKVWYARIVLLARAFVGAGFLGLISVIVGARPLFWFSILIAPPLLNRFIPSSTTRTTTPW